MMECSHYPIAVRKGYLQCMDCQQEFHNGELAKIRKERENKCSHTRLEHGYASNPPQSRCLDCGKFFKTHLLDKEKQ
jgi:DNA-directed RNA polymerase subunit RPC12/RpoP